MQPGITLLGLGPGDPKLLTRQAWDLLSNIPEIYLRTNRHPTVAGFPAGLRIHSFDHLYENGISYEDVYSQIIHRVLELGSEPSGVVYGVPGHPFVAEATAPAIARRAKDMGIPVRVVEGISFLEPVMAMLGVDPFPQTVLVDALELALAHTPSFPPSYAALVAQIHSPSIATEVKLTLMEGYPDEHLVNLVHAAGSSETRVETLPLYEIDRSPYIGLLTCLYIPPLGKDLSFEGLQEIVAHLRAPEGCPWDREQTHQTLRRNLLEEVYEVLSALDSDDPSALSDELGDLLFQIVFHAQIASEYGEFVMSDVLQAIQSKLIRRHPHVFGDLEIKDSLGVVQNWERLKAAERATSGKKEESLLDSIPTTLPALLQAEAFQRRVAHVGFDWPDVQGVLEKVKEEFEEVNLAPDLPRKSAEIGDLLFTIVNLARWHYVEAESALREANTRFRERFTRIEQAARTSGRELTELTLEEMDALWEQAKNDRSV